MLSYPALEKLSDQLRSTAKNALKENDQEVINLINKLEKKMIALQDQYSQYLKVENTYINMYCNLEDHYYYKSSGKFSINKINDFSEYQKAYEACEKFRNLYEDLCIEIEKCHLLDIDNENLTDDEKKNIKYKKWLEEIDEFQKEIHDEIQWQINENENEFYETVKLIKTKLFEEKSEND